MRKESRMRRWFCAGMMGKVYHEGLSGAEMKERVHPIPREAGVEYQVFTWNALGSTLNEGDWRWSYGA